jgi:hypothetical protein
VKRWPAVVLILFCSSRALAFPEGAEPGHAGLGDQPDCSGCHYLGPQPDEHSGLIFASLPKRVIAGEWVEFRLRLRDPDARVGGFQLTADAAGTMVGRFEAGQDQILTEQDLRQYLGHSQPRLSRADEESDGRVIEWTVRWRAPDQAGVVTFAGAAVAADDDASALGDNAYRLESEIEVVKP